ncbi:hypothetical protein ACFX5L_09115 [Bacteroides sp. KG123]|uniref:hypothetical protein n=1 Tax=unclassified Bacteroides TaxID=2646097 RepID=UPI003D7FA8C0
MARKKSFFDILLQSNRIGEAIGDRYRNYPRNSPEYAEGVRRQRKRGQIYKKYAQNIDKHFGGRLSGNQPLIRRKLSRNIYMGIKAKGTVAG